jgi:hypothetical protein
MRFKAVRNSFLFIGLFLEAVTCTYTIAQTAVDGGLSGTVEDKSGALVSNASVTAHNNATSAEIVATSDGSGFFRAVHLQPGVYTVTVSASGFETFKAENVQVTVGEVTDLQPMLALGAASATIEVTDQAPAINQTNNDFTNVIDNKVLEDVPVNNYRWSAYALQTPGVVESGGVGLLSFRGQSTLLNNITIDGADDNQAFFSEERGRTNIGYSTPKSAIQEFQVNTSNYSTEYGRSAGGVVNSVTKSGGNTFHGEGYWLDRDSIFSSFNDYSTLQEQLTPGGPFTPVPVKPTDIRKQQGFAIGGPILKDKLFFFFALDQYYRNFPVVLVASNPGTFFAAPSAALPPGTACTGTNAISSSTKSAYYDSNFTADSGTCTLFADLHLANYAAGIPYYVNGQSALNTLSGPAARISDQVIFLPKIDYQITPHNHLSADVNRLRFTSPGGQQTNITATYGNRSVGNVATSDTFGVAKLDTYITSSLSNEARYQYSRDLEVAGAETPTSSYENSTLLNTGGGYANPIGIPPAVTITGGFEIGTATFYPRPAYPDERRWQTTDTVLWVHGNHTVKFGGDYIHTDDLAENLSDYYGDYAYTSLGNYLADYYLSQSPSTAASAHHYSTYAQGFGPLGFDFQTGDYAGFIQDEWKVSPRLSINGGLRYEFEQTPSAQLPNSLLPQTSSIPEDYNNIAPRVGFAWNVFGSGNTVLRGGYGIFNARLINSTIYSAISETGAPGTQNVVTGLAPTPASPVAGVQYGPTFPEIFSTSLASTVRPNPIYFNPGFKLPQIHQADLTIDQNIGGGTVFSLSWLGSFGRDLPDFEDTNLPTPVPVTFNVVNNDNFGALPSNAQYTVNFYGYPITNPVTKQAAPAVVDNNRPNANFTNTTEIFSGVTSNYEALVAQVQHRFSHSIQFQGSYTWSHSLDYGVNDTTFSNTDSVSDPHNLRGEYGNSTHNVPNRFIATAVINSPWKARGLLAYLVNGYELSPSFSAQNGSPITALLTSSPTSLLSSGSVTGYIAPTNGAGYNGSGTSTHLPGLERNDFRLPNEILLDARVSKRLAFVKDRYNLEILAESFNLANHQNVTSATTSAYAAGITTVNGVTENTLTETTIGTFGVPSESNNNNIYTPRQLQLGLRLQF